ncbi:MAG TPA: UbiA prenyltransferase family protein [Acidobacteriaceae bacterium]|jgi:4-hydroxybenzoate polyprenyltransferase|nr:UbiA prenyltransferase family protein [Acidobacteriaceae bacterium]
MSETAQMNVSFSRRLRAHLAIARLDHSIKNLFVLPGIIVPLSIYPRLLTWRLTETLAWAFVAITLVACSNYVLNEVLDAPFDRLHPTKKNRPAALGLVNIPLAYAQWILMMLAGVAIGWTISRPFAVTALALWVMGCVYNIPPLRTKDVPYLDVLTESVNNPLRMLLGWYAVAAWLVPPLSLLVCYWMIGCYFMALKRFSELRELGEGGVAGAYRASFKRYTQESLLVSVVFYASAAMLFFGAFVIRYRIELLLGFPLVALVMAIYFKLAFKRNSAVQNPEKLYREPGLMLWFSATVVVMVVLLFVRLSWLERLFMPTLPVVQPTSVAAPVSQVVPMRFEVRGA